MRIRLALAAILATGATGALLLAACTAEVTPRHVATPSVPSVPEEPPEPGSSVPIEGAGHIPAGETASYGTIPPASGPHWPVWAQCGVYDEELPDELIVHNLEHANVVISHNLKDGEEIRKLREVAAGLLDFRRWEVVRPYSKIEQGRVAMSAWGVIDEFGGVDAERIRRFFQAYAGGSFAPELVPCG